MNRTVIFLLCSLPNAVVAQTTIDWTAPTMVANASHGCTRPRIVLNGDGNPVVLWGRMSGMKADFVAVGNGAGFEPAVQVTYMSTPPAIADWMGPDIAAFGNEVWVCFKATPEDVMPMYARRSLDGGYTWGDTIRISTDPWTRFPGIAIGSAGEPVAQYMQFDDGFANARYVTTRMIGGVFQPPVQASTPFAPGAVCDCCPGQVIAAGDVVVPMYRNAGSNIRVMYGAVSTDGGDSYAEGGLLDQTNWNHPVCPSSGPDGYIVGDSIRYAWMSGAVNGTKVHVGSAALAGPAIGLRRFVQPGLPAGTVQNFPRVAGNGDTLGVVWEQLVGGEYNVLFSWSSTGILGLGAPDTLDVSTSGQHHTPDIAYANGTFHFVWSDEAMGVVSYRTATLSSATVMAHRTPHDQLNVWPSPASTVLNVHLPTSSYATLRLFDTLGSCVLTERGSRQMDVSGLAPGSYVLQAVDAHGRAMGQVTVQVTRQ